MVPRWRSGDAIGIAHDNRETLRDFAKSAILVAVLFLILAPIAAQVIKFAISRKREHLADASGALLTRYPEGLAMALEKIAKHPTQMKRASDATAHLYISSPFRGKEGKNWIHKLFMTHPPLEERLYALRGLKSTA